MAKRAWSVDLEGTTFQIVFSHSFFTQRGTVTVNGEPVVLRSLNVLSQGDYEFEIGSTQITVTVRMIFFRHFDLFVDGKSVDSGFPLGGLVIAERAGSLFRDGVPPAAKVTVPAMLLSIFGVLFSLRYLRPPKGDPSGASWLPLALASLVFVSLALASRAILKGAKFPPRPLPVRYPLFTVQSDSSVQESLVSWTTKNRYKNAPEFLCEGVLCWKKSGISFARYITLSLFADRAEIRAWIKRDKVPEYSISEGGSGPQVRRFRAEVDSLCETLGVSRIFDRSRVG
ncbi:MAG: hypothetical protein IT285_01115 [Bdellovibrionales bacterium]|nr:hypothetical protein [Bdellovibrionales bacterium]